MTLSVLRRILPSEVHHPVDSFTVSTFAPYVGETFRIDPGAAEPIATELIEAREFGRQAGAGPSSRLERTPFSLVFRGPSEILLPQRIYRLEHDRLGAFELFLVPIGPDGEGMCYEAVFT